MKESNVRVLRILSLLILLALIPIFEFYMLNNEIGSFKKSYGTIVGISPSKCGPRKSETECWYLIIEYKVSETETNRILSESKSSFTPVGKSRIVLINPQNPYDARDGGFGGVWFPLKLHIFFVFCFTVFAILVYLQEFKLAIRLIFKKIRKVKFPNKSL